MLRTVLSRAPPPATSRPARPHGQAATPVQRHPGLGLGVRRGRCAAPLAALSDEDSTAKAAAAAAEAARLLNKTRPAPGPGASGRDGHAGWRSRRPPSSSTTATDGDGTFALILINALVFLAARFTPLPVIPTLALVHASPSPWQFLTCAFTHADFGHLAGNLFSLLVFGRMVEEEEGVLGVVATYCVCGAAAAAASYAALPSNSISLGASGSIFGLFIVAVAGKLRPSLKKLTECGVLGLYVSSQLAAEVKAQAAVMGWRAGAVAGGGVISHVAHIGGALAGVALVALLARLPAAAEE